MPIHLSRDRPLLLFIELLLLATVLVAAYWGTPPVWRWVRRAELALRRLSRRRALAFVLVGLLPLLGGATVSTLVRFPHPRFHDEFSYLLAADTFAHGRLANPTHPMWIHFESFHIIHQPTYVSKYPPGQGLVLALGKLIGGHAVVGLWISVALACIAIYWMLLAWVPPYWALLGGILAALRFGIVGYWSQSYWGGAVAAIGGALLFGALRRLMRHPRASTSLLLGVGVAILANSRPYEGLLTSVPAAAVLLAWMIGKQGPPPWVTIRSIVAPILAVLVPTAMAMGLYNSRTTGDPLRMPYEVHEATYTVAPTFLWQPLRREPPYHHEVMREHWVNAHLGGTGGAAAFVKQQSIGGFLRVTARKMRMLSLFYLGLVFAVPLLALPWVLRDRWMRLALVTCGAVTLGLLSVAAYTPHYGAPVTALVFALVLQGMRYVRLWRWRGRPIGRALVGAIPLIIVVGLGIGIAEYARADASAWHLKRARIQADLQERSGQHLVIVRYAGAHWPGEEWVYNEADIDRAKVVWAREIDAVHERTLIEYFKHRHVWLLDADSASAEPVPYRSADTRRAARVSVQ